MTLLVTFENIFSCETFSTSVANVIFGCSMFGCVVIDVARPREDEDSEKFEGVGESEKTGKEVGTGEISQFRLPGPLRELS